MNTIRLLRPEDMEKEIEYEAENNPWRLGFHAGYADAEKDFREAQKQDPEGKAYWIEAGKSIGRTELLKRIGSESVCKTCGKIIWFVLVPQRNPKAPPKWWVFGDDGQYHNDPEPF